MPKVDFKDYYQVLGVDKGADDKALKSAFRKLARKFHPDVNPGNSTAEESFKEVNEAYDVLSDPEKRKLYDRYGEEWQRYKEAGYTGDEPAGSERSQDFGSWFSGGGAGGARYTTSSADYDDDFSDFFNTVFTSSRSSGFGSSTRAQSRTRPTRGADMEAEVAIDFDEAFNGTTRMFDLQTQELCPECSGSGVIGNRVCSNCRGSGYVPRTRTIEVKIPAGVTNGSRIRVAGQGGAGQNGGANGDVYLVVDVKEDPRFERDGANLKTVFDLPLYTAILGGEAIIDTPSGKVALNIPKESAQGKVFRLKGKGMPKLKSKGERGDLLARANIVMPENLSSEERKLFTDLSELRKGSR